MDKYAFLHEEERLNDCLGISERRHREIIKQCEIALIEGEEILSKSIEWAMNKLEPKNMVEAAYIDFLLKTGIDFKNPLYQLGLLFSQIREHNED